MDHLILHLALSQVSGRHAYILQVFNTLCLIEYFFQSPYLEVSLSLSSSNYLLLFIASSALIELFAGTFFWYFFFRLLVSDLDIKIISLSNLSSFHLDGEVKFQTHRLHILCNQPANNSSLYIPRDFNPLYLYKFPDGLM